MSHLTVDINDTFNAHVLYLFTHYRHFASADGATEAEDLKTKIVELSNEISRLQSYELDLAAQYGITGAPDSVEVFLETKTRALLLKDSGEPCAFALKKLNNLYKLRLEFASVHKRLPAFQLQYPLHKMLSHRPIKRMDASRFWGVCIGIDAYSTSELHGCVSDALLMEDYLHKHIGVPKDRLQLLLGRKKRIPCDNNTIPSRKNIIATLHSLITNPNIEHGDNIVIYFSGHGSSYLLEHYYCKGVLNSELDVILSAGAVEALCPIDRDELDDQGFPVPDISDREINVIFSELSRAKGNHITLILDCCHSSGITRSISQPGVRSLGSLPRPSFNNMLLIADENSKQFSHHRSVFDEDWHPDTESHVVLAACGEYQFAKEIPGDTGYNGFFTKSLIWTLTSSYLTEETTYVDLVASLDRSCHQTPVAAGKHKYCKLWYQK